MKAGNNGDRHTSLLRNLKDDHLRHSQSARVIYKVGVRTVAAWVETFLPCWKVSHHT